MFTLASAVSIGAVLPPVCCSCESGTEEMLSKIIVSCLAIVFATKTPSVPTFMAV